MLKLLTLLVIVKNMRLKITRTNKVYYYYRFTSCYEILKRYDKHHVNKRIEYLNEQIKDMYHLNVSHVTSTSFGFNVIGCQVDTLAIWIIEQKEALERYKAKSRKYINTYNKLLDTYDKHEQQYIKEYISAKGKIKPISVVRKFVNELHDIEDNERIQRENKRKNDRLKRILNI